MMYINESINGNFKKCKYGHLSKRYKNGNCIECKRISSKKESELKRLASKKKRNGYWTKERCLIEALKYKQRRHFEMHCGSAYIISMRNKWLDEICSHMVSPQRKSGYWNKEMCRVEALKYSNLNEFKLLSSGAYSSASKNKWIGDICSHMISTQKPKKYWDKNRCFNEATKYKTRSHLATNNPYVYSVLIRNGWIDSACSHMGRILSDYDALYVWETSFTSENNNPIYKIGVTSKRLNYKRIKQCSLSINTKIINLIIYVETKEAKIIERNLLKIGKKYNIKKGNGRTELRELSAIDLNNMLVEVYSNEL